MIINRFIAFRSPSAPCALDADSTDAYQTVSKGLTLDLDLGFITFLAAQQRPAQRRTRGNHQYFFAFNRHTQPSGIWPQEHPTATVSGLQRNQRAQGDGFIAMLSYGQVLVA